MASKECIRTLLYLCLLICGMLATYNSIDLYLRRETNFVVSQEPITPSDLPAITFLFAPKPQVGIGMVPFFRIG